MTNSHLATAFHLSGVDVKISILIFFTFSAGIVTAVAGQTAQLDRYIEEGLAHNPSLRQEQADYRSAEESVREATARFMPSLWLKARYTRADGGRSVTLPVGEIVQKSFAGTPLAVQFAGSPPPDPITLYIMPKTEQETKLQLVQPLFAPTVAANYRLNRHLLSVREQATLSAALALVRDIRLAFYTCLQARDATTVYSAALDRSERHRSIARKLYAAGMSSETAVARAQAAYSLSRTAYEQGRAEFTNACRALNILVERPLDSLPDLEPPDSAAFLNLLEATDSAGGFTDSLALSRRPEILQLEAAATAARAYVTVEKSGFAPTVAAAFEGGITGDRYDITDRSAFYTASILLDWELFSGLGRKRKVSKARAGLDKLLEQTAAARRQISFQVAKTASDFALARRTCRDGDLQVAAARKNHHTVSRQYEEGLATFNQLADAEELLTEAETAQTVARYDLFKQQAHMRYAVAADLGTIQSVIPAKGIKP